MMARSHEATPISARASAIKDRPRCTRTLCVEHELRQRLACTPSHTPSQRVSVSGNRLPAPHVPPSSPLAPAPAPTRALTSDRAPTPAPALDRALNRALNRPALAVQSSVLPTPVGPRKKKDAIGRAAELRPARDRRIALLTAVTASACPTTRSVSFSSMCSSLSRSPLMSACRCTVHTRKPHGLGTQVQAMGHLRTEAVGT